MRKDTRTFPNSLLDPLRQQGDLPADAVVAEVAATGGPREVGELMKFLTDYENFDFSAQPNSVQLFIAENNKLPIWTDQEQFKQGIAFFWEHYRLIALLLGTYALPYCYAGANGAQVLWISERIRTKTHQRLEETGAFVFGIMQERDWKSGLNVRRIAKIRLLHAAVRWFTLHSGRWNPDWGYPVCQEDMAGTNLAFSYIILRGLRKLQVQATRAQEEAYLHFWKVVGYLLGTQEVLLPGSLLEAYTLDRAIARRQFRASEAGRGLTQALLRTIEAQVPSPSLHNLPAAQMRYFLGNELAELLGIPPTTWEKRVVDLAFQVPIFPQLLTMQRPESGVLERYWR